MQWTSDNGKWSIHEVLVATYDKNGNRQWIPRLVIEEIKDTGYIDYPIMYDNKTFAFDNPEKIPEYVKEQYKRMRLAE